MGYISDQIKHLKDAGGFLGSIASGISNWWHGATGSQLTDAQQQANQFSAQQAQQAREWEEQMFNQYNSPSALVRQYQSAGINPALMFGGSTPAAPQATGAASSVSPSTPGFDMLSSLAQLASLKSDINLKNAQAGLINSQKSGQDIENEFKPDVFRQNLAKGEVEISNLRAGIDKINAEVQKIGKDMELTDSQIALNAAHGALSLAQSALAKSQESYISSQKFEQDWKNNFLNRWGFDPSDKLFGIPLDMLAAGSDILSVGLQKLKKLFAPGSREDVGTIAGMLADSGLDDRSIINALRKLGVKFSESVSNLWNGVVTTSENAAQRLKNILSYGIFE